MTESSAKKIKLEPMGLRRALTDAQIETKEQLIAILEKQNLTELKGVVEKNGYNGRDFRTHLEKLQQQYSDEIEALAKEIQGVVIDAPKEKKKKIFSTNAYIKPTDDYFYVPRGSGEDLLKKVYSGGLYLVHGPRQSGKSTLMHEMIRSLLQDPGYVVVKLEVPLEIPADRFWDKVITKMRESPFTSPEVKKIEIKDPDNPLYDLFRQNYGKKLVIFWDEFDAAYKNEDIKEKCATALREIRNQRDQLPAYGSVMCFGTYHATLVNSKTVSPFPKDNVYDAEKLDFTPKENKELFTLYEEEYQQEGFKIAEEVVNLIHEMAGGHAGLTNGCGRFILEHQLKYPDDKIFTTGRFNSNLKAISKLLSELPGPNQMIENLEKADPDTTSLFGTLCYRTGVEFQRNDGAHIALLQLGFARLNGDLLVVKSEMIRLLGNRYIKGETINIAVPMTKQHQIDMPEFLCVVFSHFNPTLLESAYKYGFKAGHNQTVPHEAHYQLQFGACLTRLLLHQGWEFANETKPDVGRDEKKLDFILIKGDFQAGIELVASSDDKDVRGHARRTYPQDLNLDQYVVVHIAPFNELQSSRILEATGSDKKGKEAKIPIFQLRHTKNYNSVELRYLASGIVGFFNSEKVIKVR